MCGPDSSTSGSSSVDASAEPERVRGAIRAFVVHDEPLAGAGLEWVLQSTGAIRCLGCARTLAEAESQLESLRPDVVLLAARVLGADRETALIRLRSISPGSRLLLLAGARDAWPHQLAVAAVDGCVAETMAVEELVGAVRTVAEGAQLFVRCPDAECAAGAEAALTHRELEVLGLMAAGLTNVEIGQTLFLAAKTIERQAATITGKLGARNRAHASAIAVARGLVSIEAWSSA